MKKIFRLIILVAVAEGYCRDDGDSVLGRGRSSRGRSSASLPQVSGPTSYSHEN
jgi:hypothetical protein